MKKNLYFSVCLLVAYSLTARSEFRSSYYSSSSSAEEERVNGKLVKSKKSKASVGDEKGGRDGKILYEKSDINENAENFDPFEGIKVSGEDYFNFKDVYRNNKENKKIIKLVTGSCSINALGAGFSDTQDSIALKNADKDKAGDFLFGLFSSDLSEATNNFVSGMTQSFYDDIQVADRAVLDGGFVVAQNLNDALGYAGGYEVSAALLQDHNKAITFSGSAGFHALVLSRGKLIVVDSPLCIDKIAKGDIFIFATRLFWSVMDDVDTMNFAKKNLVKKNPSVSAIDVAENLVMQARKKGCNDAMNLLVVYIL